MIQVTNKEKVVMIERLIHCSPYWLVDEYGNAILMKVKVEMVPRKSYNK